MRIEIPVTKDSKYKPKSLVEHAYEDGKKAGVKAMLDYIRKMTMTQDYIAYDCYIEARDWAEKTFGIEVENPHPEYQEYVEMVDGILAEEKKRL